MSETALTPEQTERVVAMAMDLAREGDTGQLAEFLDHGLPVDATDPDTNTLLMLAAYHGHAGTVRALLARGADPDLRNARNQSPIAGALFKGADDVVAVLRDAGADLDAGTPSAREIAAMFGREHLLG
ncbi:ankyrin repeat domain-containing protein [Actinomadura welshii]